MNFVLAHRWYARGIDFIQHRAQFLTGLLAQLLAQQLLYRLGVEQACGLRFARKLVGQIQREFKRGRDVTVSSGVLCERNGNSIVLFSIRFLLCVDGLRLQQLPGDVARDLDS